MIQTIAKRLGDLLFYPFIILLLPVIALGIGIIFVNATVSGLFWRARWLRELRKDGRAVPAAVLLSNARGGALIVDRPGFNFKATHCWWTDAVNMGSQGVSNQGKRPSVRLESLAYPPLRPCAFAPSR
ncbi:MAG: hypothetical protein U1E05_10195 [Patescibacteria group bacterium]|nr:hypothetical protein [Patescibacteria group bacterium]